MCPSWGRGSKCTPGMCPWPGIKPRTFWYAGLFSNHWAHRPGQTFLLYNVYSITPCNSAFLDVSGHSYFPWLFVTAARARFPNARWITALFCLEITCGPRSLPRELFISWLLPTSQGISYQPFSPSCIVCKTPSMPCSCTYLLLFSLTALLTRHVLINTGFLLFSGTFWEVERLREQS